MTNVILYITLFIRFEIKERKKMQKLSLHNRYQKPSRIVGWYSYSLNCLFTDTIGMTAEPQRGDTGV